MHDCSLERGPQWPKGSARRCSTAAPTAGDGGFGSSWLVDPNYDLAIVVLTQRMFETPEAPQVHRDIQAAAYAALASPGVS